VGAAGVPREEPPPSACIVDDSSPTRTPPLSLGGAGQTLRRAKPASASPNSSTDAGRAAGSEEMARPTSSTKSAGRSASTEPSNTGGWVAM
jgi:hypothetical protein